MNARMFRAALGCVLAALVAPLGGCGGGGGEGGIFAGLDREVRTFWATDVTTNADYQLRAYKAGEGAHCYVFVEAGRTVSQSTVDAFIDEFDTNIYPRTTGAFGSEPTPGIDGDPKIYILLLDIRDGYDPLTDSSYVPGYFHPVNEFLQGSLPPGRHSNEKEMFYMDVDPGTPGSSIFLQTLAHEFQHMIHFNQEQVRKGGFVDNVWLNEAMSEIAPAYCGYGANYMRVSAFQSRPYDSLTIWGGAIPDYAVAYMWAQYVKDRIDPATGDSIFRRILQRPETGIASVNGALAEISYGKDFGEVFRDWAVANYSGNALSWAGHPEWSYTTVNTWPGIYPIGGGYGIRLPGMFGFAGWTDCTALTGLEPWSVDYYLYLPVSGSSGSVTWTRANPSGWAALGDNAVLSYNLTSGALYPYAGEGYLVVANPSDDNSLAGDGVAYASRRPAPATVAAMLAEAGRDATVRHLAAVTGRPVPVCVHPFLQDRMRPLAEMGIRPRLSPR